MPLVALQHADGGGRRRAADAPRWFQLYVFRDRGVTRDLVARAEAAGYGAIVLTVDAPVLGRRERDVRNEFELPEGLTIACVPEGEVGAPTGESGLAAYFATMLDASLDWSDLEWLASSTSLPVVVKGVHRPDDAERAIESGAAGVVVSNHGGRQLDTVPATIEMLPAVVEAVGDRADVLLDGGVRRGTDVVKALALGARAVLIGRPVLWGLAIDGAERRRGDDPDARRRDRRGDDALRRSNRRGSRSGPAGLIVAPAGPVRESRVLRECDLRCPSPTTCSPRVS